MLRICQRTQNATNVTTADGLRLYLFARAGGPTLLAFIEQPFQGVQIVFNGLPFCLRVS
ncbi:MAG: hypothetical protein RL701_5170, partial [Pseudomonadota bacterium]